MIPQVVGQIATCVLGAGICIVALLLALEFAFVVADTVAHATRDRANRWKHQLRKHWRNNPVPAPRPDLIIKTNRNW